MPVSHPLVARLAAAEGRERVDVIGQLAAAPAHALDALRDALEQQALDVWLGLDALVGCGPRGLAQVLGMASRLDGLGRAALVTLCRQPSPPFEVLGPLERHLTGADAALRTSAWAQLSELAPRAGVAWAEPQRAALASLAEALAPGTPAEAPDVLPARVEALGLLRANPAVMVPWCHRALTADFGGATDSVRAACCRALGWYGPAAREASEELLRLFESNPGRWTVAAAALVGLGGDDARRAAPRVAAAQQAYQGSTASQTKQFRATLGRLVKALEGDVAARPASKKRRGLDVDAVLAPVPELRDLLERLARPPEPWAGSSAQTTSFRAHREAERASEPAWVPVLEALAAAAVPEPLFGHAQLVLSKLAGNLGGATATAAQLAQWARGDLTAAQRQAVLDGLARSLVPAALPALLDALRRMQAGARFDLFAVAEYAGVHPNDALLAPLVDVVATSLDLNTFFVALNVLHVKSAHALRLYQQVLTAPVLLTQRKADVELRCVALAGLGRLGDAAGLALLHAEVAADRPATREVAAAALARLTSALASAPR